MDAARKDQGATVVVRVRKAEAGFCVHCVCMMSDKGESKRNRLNVICGAGSSGEESSDMDESVLSCK
jgi:hypothetical protein